MEKIIEQLKRAFKVNDIEFHLCISAGYRAIFHYQGRIVSIWTDDAYSYFRLSFYSEYWTDITELEKCINEADWNANPHVIYDFYYIVGMPEEIDYCWCVQENPDRVAIRNALKSCFRFGFHVNELEDECNETITSHEKIDWISE